VRAQNKRYRKYYRKRYKRDIRGGKEEREINGRKVSKKKERKRKRKREKKKRK